MKTSATYTLLFATLAQFTNAAYCGDAEPVHPAKALYEEFEALRAFVKPGPPAAYKAEFAPAIKGCREKIIAYTKTHQDGDLDALNWGNALESVYSTSAFREWKTCRESEANIREAWEILAKLKLENSQKAADLSLELARWHIESWCTLNPEECAEFMDETAVKFLEKVSPDAVRGWKFFAPSYEEGFVLAAATLPPKRRAAFARKREDGLLHRLQDESVSINTRSDQLGSYASQLYGEGEVDRATALLDPWWTKYGEKIHSPLFYSARFHTACYGTGDWAKACETLRRMDKLVKAGVIPSEDPLYKLMLGNYHKNVPYSEEELKRRAAILNEEKKKARKNAKQSQ